jgi:hypothetical protein
VGSNRTFGIAYTKLPNGADVEGSGDVVVRKTRSEVPVSVSWTWILVCGALGKGNETAIGLPMASLSGVVADML